MAAQTGRDLRNNSNNDAHNHWLAVQLLNFFKVLILVWWRGRKGSVESFFPASCKWAHERLGVGSESTFMSALCAVEVFFVFSSGGRPQEEGTSMSEI